MTHVRPLQPDTDRAEWIRMRHALWPEVDEQVHMREEAAQLEPVSATVFVVDRGDGKLGGFAEALIKDWAEGCFSGRVAYVEGWYVDEDLRGQGWGRALVAKIEEWARSMGCTELASDTWVDNTGSQQAHLRLGFTEYLRLTHYRKDL